MSKKYALNQPMTHVQMDPNYAENTWALLKGAIHEIHKQNASGLSFEELYRNAYNMVLHKYGDMLYRGLEHVVHDHLHAVAASVVGEIDENFLGELTRAWSNHKISMLMIRDILMYMDRVYVPLCGDCEQVYDMGLRLFRDNVAQHVKVRSRLQDTLLTLIHQERCGEVINRGMMKTVTQMLMDLGVNSRVVYAEDFEAGFLQAAAVFYRHESQEFIAMSSCPEYLRKVESRLKEEINRVDHYLDQSTRAKIVDVVEREMLANHLATIVDNPDTGFLVMLREDQVEDLARTYNLLSRIEGGPAAMRGRIGDFITEVGFQIVSETMKAMQVAVSTERGFHSRRANRTYIPRLLQLKDKFDQLLEVSFRGDSTFQKAMNLAFERVINDNAASPEYISLFIDWNLKHGLKGSNDDEVDTVLDKAMALFRFVQDKDVFERYYKQHLAKRLLLGRSISDLAERNMIVKLKTECGYHFTSKLEGMFQDMKTSEDVMDHFATHLTQKVHEPLRTMELNVQVLTTGFWPIVQQACKCKLPPQIYRACQVFKRFYLSRHSGRRLTWQTNMGTADVRVDFGRKRHVLNVSTYQMVILLMFNQAPVQSLANIEATTGILEADLMLNLASLVKFKVLRKVTPAAGSDGGAALEGDSFAVNHRFKSKFHRVKVGLGGTQLESAEARRVTTHKITEDRKLAIQACIVRVMKARKHATHPQLVSEVTSQLAGRFPPDPFLIKKQVETLIEREYLQRSAKDRRSYTYVA